MGLFSNFTVKHRITLCIRQFEIRIYKHKSTAPRDIGKDHRRNEAGQVSGKEKSKLSIPYELFVKGADFQSYDKKRSKAQIGNNLDR